MKYECICNTKKKNKWKNDVVIITIIKKLIITKIGIVGIWLLITTSAVMKTNVTDILIEIIRVKIHDVVITLLLIWQYCCQHEGSSTKHCWMNTDVEFSKQTEDTFRQKARHILPLTNTKKKRFCENVSFGNICESGAVVHPW